MKKIYILYAVFFTACWTGLAQPVLNSTDFTYYESDSYKLNTIPALSVGSAGANQTWNFSALTSLIFDGKFSAIPAASTTYASTFPTANFTFKDDSDGSSYYSYFKITDTSMELVGTIDVSSAEILSNSHTFLEFPYTYNKVITDTYLYSPIVVTVTTTYDAYGTLITPFETFTNVIRQKRVYTSEGLTNTIYSWHTTNKYKLILDIGFFDGDSTPSHVYIYTNFTSLGLNDFKKETALKLYPNPASTTVHLQLANNQNIDQITITNILGQIVLAKNKVMNPINIESLRSGMYIMEVISGSEKFQSKFVKN